MVGLELQISNLEVTQLTREKGLTDRPSRQQYHPTPACADCRTRATSGIRPAF